MEKQFNWLIVLLVTLFSIFLSSCKEENNNEPELASIEILGGKEFTVSAEGGTVNVRFTSDCQWIIEPSDYNPTDDVVMTPTSGGTGYNSVSVKIPKNKSNHEVFYTFKLIDTKTGWIIATFNVTQDAGNIYIECEGKNIRLPYEECEAKTRVWSNDVIEATVREEDKSWLDAYIVKESNTQSNLYSLHIHALKPSFYEKGRVRVGRITITTSAMIKTDIYITQECWD